jgi:hypothetical protein
MHSRHDPITKQSTDTIAMVRPAAFGFNEQTAANNFFQDPGISGNASLQEKAVQEFDAMVNMLDDAGVRVLVLSDNSEPPKPDAIFPNNWFTCQHHVIDVFPLYATNRRPEKRQDLVQQLKAFTKSNTVNDLSENEEKGRFLEGTGSMVFDHVNRSIYACLSPRTDQELFEQYAISRKFNPVSFSAWDAGQQLIYHTNVMLSIGSGFVVICEESLKYPHEKKQVLQSLAGTSREMIYISQEQVRHFAGNLLELHDKKNNPVIVISKTAYCSLEKLQVQQLEKHGNLIVPDVSTIERASGGSVRCMMAEIF